MGGEDTLNQATDQINILATSKAALAGSDIDVRANIPRKKKSRTGVLLDHNQKGKKNSNNKGLQSYCMVCRDFGIPKRKYKYHGSYN